ncbi:hypothetical protein PI125_g21031 [Phytophthora idaei]|nr:hypothetical protein PI125_g21031 [Phytophthora idaei]
MHIVGATASTPTMIWSHGDPVPYAVSHSSDGSAEAAASAAGL